MTLRKTLSVAIALATLSGTAAAEGLKFDKADNRFSWDSLSKFENMDLSGKTVRFDGPWIDGDEANLRTVIAYFEEATGATVEYNGSNDFEQLVLVDMKAGNPPNLAAWPQPGTVSELASQGNLVALSDGVEKAVGDNYAAGQSWVDLGTYKGADGKEAMFGLPYNVNLKSLVWYVPENFEEMGYEIPQSMEELIALSDQIVKDGGTPWCIGMESGGATGWVGTDWMEDLMLRTQPPSVYDQWVSNEMPFNDPKVIEVMNTFGQFVLNDDYVDGSSSAVASIFFGDSPKGLFDTPPKCYMHRQASFIPAFFPEGPIAHELWMAGQGFLTPHKGAKLEAYSSDTLRKQGEIFLNATTFRFDASDLMPGAIGAGAFWTGMVDFTSGKSAEEVTTDIQKAWDAIK